MSCACVEVCVWTSGSGRQFCHQIFCKRKLPSLGDSVGAEKNLQTG